MKIKYNIEALPQKLEQEVKVIDENFRILYKDGVVIELFDIRDININTLDENEEIISTSITYEKRHKEEQVIDEETVLVDVWSAYDFDLSKLDSIITNHDINTPYKSEVEQLKETVDMLLIDSLGGL